MPYRVIQIITKRSIKTPGPLTLEEATILARHHDNDQLSPDWNYEIEHYEDQDSTEEATE